MLQPYLHKGLSECGLDEAGRGCLAGGVYAAAVILPNFDEIREQIILQNPVNDNAKPDPVNDKMFVKNENSPKHNDRLICSDNVSVERLHNDENKYNIEELKELFTLLNDSKQLSDKQRRKLRPIIERNAVAFAVFEVTNEEIDKINILEASITAMNGAVKRLTVRPEFLLVDGNRFHTDTNIPFKTVIKGDATFMSIAAASVLAKTYRDDAMIELSKRFPMYNWQKNKGYPTKDHRKAIAEYGITPFHRKTFNLLGEPTLF